VTTIAFMYNSRLHSLPRGESPDAAKLPLYAVEYAACTCAQGCPAISHEPATRSVVRCLRNPLAIPTLKAEYKRFVCNPQFFAGALVDSDD